MRNSRTASDVSSDEGLRSALREVIEAGWDSACADAVGAEIVAEAHRRVGGLAARRRGMGFAEARADLASRAWEAVRTQPGRICSAEGSPWGLVVTIAARQAAKEDAAARLVGMAVPHAARRAAEAVAVELQDFSAAAQVRTAVQPLRGAAPGKHATAFGADDLGPLLVGISDLLAAHGLGRARARRAVARAGEIAMRERASYRHGAARRDAEPGGVLHALGFSPDRASALMNLLVGTRRGGPQTSVLLHAFARGHLGGPALSWAQMNWLFRAATPPHTGSEAIQMPLPFVA